jgi:hypothetical protein
MTHPSAQPPAGRTDRREELSAPDDGVTVINERHNIKARRMPATIIGNLDVE